MRYHYSMYIYITNLTSPDLISADLNSSELNGCWAIQFTVVATKVGLPVLHLRTRTVTSDFCSFWSPLWSRRY